MKRGVATNLEARGKNAYLEWRYRNCYEPLLSVCLLRYNNEHSYINQIATLVVVTEIFKGHFIIRISCQSLLIPEGAKVTRERILNKHPRGKRVASTLEP